MELENPPRPLGRAGRDLWDRITTEYVVEDAAGIEQLALACEAVDRAEALHAAIESAPDLLAREVRGACKDELACRAFVARVLQRLGLGQPVRAPGRPPGIQWSNQNQGARRKRPCGEVS
jgi:hypothetical protein